MAIVDPRAAKLVTGRHWVEDDGAARLEATEKGIVERRGDCYEFRGAEKSDRPEKSSILEIVRFLVADFSLGIGGKSHYLRAKTDLLWGA